MLLLQRNLAELSNLTYNENNINMDATLIISLLFVLIINFILAELFGRSKHIGRWWTFLLLGSFFIPGILAWIFSPSANRNPTVANKTVNIIGWVILIILGVIPIIPSIIFNLYGAYAVSILFISVGAYLIVLGKGKVINRNPKFYFGFLISQAQNIFTNTLAEIKPFTIKQAPKIAQFYYIVEDGKQSEAYTFDQLKEKRIKEDDKVWRKGLEKWLPAKDISELESIILYLPPPLIKEEPVLFSEEVIEEVRVSSEVVTKTSDPELVVIPLPTLNVFERLITWLTFTASYLIILISFILLSKDAKIHYKQKLRKYYQE